ncbi:hypothetical protein Tco_1331232, partial [Tanacetum coccineum]
MAFCSCGRQAVIKTSWSDGHPVLKKGIEGSSKPSIPPFGSAKRPRTVPKNLIDWYGYVGTWLPEEGGVDEFPAETDKEDEDCQKIVKSPTP